jgi:hypothetical protein
MKKRKTIQDLTLKQFRKIINKEMFTYKAWFLLSPYNKINL